jgi:large subunit ribosomal protein L35
MPKHKTHKGLAKRVKVTARGKIKLHKAGASHLMSVKNAKRRRHIRRTGSVNSNVYAQDARGAGELRVPDRSRQAKLNLACFPALGRLTPSAWGASPYQLPQQA